MFATTHFAATRNKGGCIGVQCETGGGGGCSRFPFTRAQLAMRIERVRIPGPHRPQQHANAHTHRGKIRQRPPLNPRIACRSHAVVGPTTLHHELGAGTGVHATSQGHSLTTPLGPDGGPCLSARARRAAICCQVSPICGCWIRQNGATTISAKPILNCVSPPTCAAVDYHSGRIHCMVCLSLLSRSTASHATFANAGDL